MKQFFRAVYIDSRDSWQSLLRKPLRSILSSLGIGIGVTALIAMLSISEGAKQSALKKISSLGVNTLRIENRIQAEQNGLRLANLSLGLNLSDSQDLSDWIGQRGRVGSYVRLDNLRVQAPRQAAYATILGADPNWFAAERLHLTQGRPLTEPDLTAQERFCIVGANISQSLQTSLLDTLTFANQPATVVGIAAKRGRLLTEGTGLASLDFDNTVYLPLPTMPARRSGSHGPALDGIIITIKNPEQNNILVIAHQLEQLLLDNHRGVKDFEVVVPLSLLAEAQASQRMFSLIMGTIAGLSLIVGGIGVLNVMLANIAEQTRDIGLRMAVGATRMRIVSLYLWHSILLALSGSIWGSVMGILVALVIQNYAEWEVSFSAFSLILAPLSALLTGIVFGIHPALRAASLEPAHALRDV